MRFPGNLAETVKHINAPERRGGKVYPDYPDALSKGEFALMRFSLELLDGGAVELQHLLGMRRRLRRCSVEVLGVAALTMFEPPLSCDPVAVRRHQKPAPGFVLVPDTDFLGERLVGDQVNLDVVFLGDAVQAIADFSLALQRLGACGLADGDLTFEVAAVLTMGPDGDWRPLPGDSLPGVANFAPDLLRLDQWLDRTWPQHAPLALEFLTPTRLATDGRFLRHPRFDQIFPFMLRRVTALLHAHCALEPVDDPSPLLGAARRVVAVWETIAWVDWRDAGDGKCLGGVTGTLRLDGPGLGPVLWVILLATLFGIGKGAAYGAGRCRLAPPAPC